MEGLLQLAITSIQRYESEILGSLVSEPKHRDSRFKSCLGIGIEIQAWKVSESVSEPKLRHSKSRNRKSDIPSLRIGTGIQI